MGTQGHTMQDVCCMLRLPPLGCDCMFCSVSSVARAEKDNVCFIARIHVKVFKKIGNIGK